MSNFNTTLVKVHQRKKSSDSKRNQDFNTTLVKVHPNKLINLIEKYNHFNTTLVKVHLRFRAGKTMTVP